MTQRPLIWLGGALGSLLLAGCPQPPPSPPQTCGNADPPTIVLIPNHGAMVPLADGVLLPVFPPPQGGVFTELNVAISGIRAEELVELRINAVDDTEQPLVAQRYFGPYIPLFCREDQLEVDDMPVAFSDSVMLYELDGVPVTMEVIMDTERGTVQQMYSLTLEVTDY